MNLWSRLAAASLASSMFLAGCTAMPPSADVPDLKGTAWVLSAVPGQSPVADSAVTMRFEGGRVHGTDGCNRYATTYMAKGSAIEFGAKGAATMMACPPALMKQAEAFTNALTRARSHRVAGGRLELLSADGAVVATFAAQAQSLAGTSWRVTGFNNGRQAVVSVLPGTNVTMAFSGDGKVAGSAGCNRYTATYAVDGQKLTLGPAAATRRMCATPDRVMEQEHQFLKALETVATTRFEANRLELRTADGALAATLARDPG